MSGRPRAWRVAKLRQRIRVDNAVTASDDYGQPIVTWTQLYAEEPASFQPASGGEAGRGRQVESFINAIFTVHYRSTYRTSQSILYNGVRYGIVYVKPVEGNTRYLELFTKAIQV